jgi:hypothetical protein
MVIRKSNLRDGGNILIRSGLQSVAKDRHLTGKTVLEM